MTFPRATLLSLLLLLVGAPVANANTYRVAAPLGAGDNNICSPCQTIAGALQHADDNIGPDTVIVPAGTYDVALTIAASNQVTMIGAGPGKTILRDTTAYATAPLVMNNGIVRGMTFQDTENRAVEVNRGVLENFSVEETAPADALEFGVKIGGGDVVVRDCDITLGHDIGGGTADVWDVHNTGDVTVSDCTVEGIIGVMAEGSGRTRITHSTIRTSHWGVAAFKGAAVSVEVYDTVVVAMNSLMFTAQEMIHFEAAAAVAPQMWINGVTLVGSALDGDVGLRAVGDAAGEDLSAFVLNTAFYNLGDDIQLHNAAGGVANAYVDNSFYDALNVTLTGGAFAPTANDSVAGDPKLRNAGAGDYRPRFDSPLIDEGWGSQDIDWPTTDFRGLPRAVDGDHNASAVQDIGAFEFQPAARNTVRPKISGTPDVGRRLTCKKGTWGSGGGKFSYRWKRGSGNITGATASTYRVRRADNGRKLSCVVTATTADEAKSASSKAVRI